MKTHIHTYGTSRDSYSAEARYLRAFMFLVVECISDKTRDQQYSSPVCVSSHSHAAACKDQLTLNRALSSTKVTVVAAVVMI